MAATVDAEQSYTYIAKLTDATALNRRVKELLNSRNPLELEWKENLNFYLGNQYVYVNKRARKLDSLPTGDGEKPRHRIRLVSNTIMDGTQRLLAQLLKTKPVLSATPESSDDHSFKAAQMAERLLEWWWLELKLADKYREALLWAIIAGQGYLKISWDSMAGKPIKFLVDHDGNPIVNQQLRTAFKEEIQQSMQGGYLPADTLEQLEQTFYLGEIRVDVLSPFDVIMDDQAGTHSEAKWAITVAYMNPDEAYARYKKRLKPDSLPATHHEILPMGGVDRSRRTVCTIYTLHHIPSTEVPEGRVLTWSGGVEAVVLEDSKWTCECRDLNIIKFPGIRVPGAIYDDSVVKHAVPIQKELNKGLSQVIEHRNLTIRPQMLSPLGAIRQKLTNEAGLLIQYNPVNGLEPKPLNMPALQPYIFEFLRDMQARIDRIFAVNEITEGKPPPNVEAGIAIDLLQEMATDRLSPIIHQNEEALAQVGQVMLAYAHQYYIEPRLMKIKGRSGSPQAHYFKGSDVPEGIVVRAETGSGLPRLRASRQAMLDKMVNMGMLTPKKAAKFYDLADLSSVVQELQGDIDQAHREHEKLVQNKPLNPIALHQALQTVNTPDPQTGVPLNPETGQPFQGQQDVQEFLERAAISPTDYEDWQTHLEEHKLEMVSPDFEEYPPDVQQRFIDHYLMTLDKLMAMKRQPDKIEPTKVSAQVKMTAGPTAAAAMLNQAGLYNISPSDMAEPPLETMVIDSVDKPDDPNAQTAPLVAAHERALAQQQQEQQQATAQQAHDMQMAQQEQAMAHKAEDHSLKQVHADQAHEAKLQQLKQKPPSGGKR